MPVRLAFIVKLNYQRSKQRYGLNFCSIVFIKKIAFLGSLAAVHRVVAGCPHDFIYSAAVNGCYAVVEDNLEWMIAGLRCKALDPNAHLLVIDDAEEQQAIGRLLSGYNRT